MKNDNPIKASVTHSSGQKPKNLYQNDIKKPAITNTPLTRRPGRTMDVAPRSSKIQHFAPKIFNHIVRKDNSPADIKPTRHPLALRADKKIQSLNMQPKIAPPKTMKETKEAAISEAMSKTSIAQPKKGFFKKNIKFINIFSISLAILLITGCVVYLNMPSLSVKVASMQAGINATFPEFHPDGFSVNGPVSYDNGEVTINFKSNTGDSKFTIKQAKSSWDSSAVRNKVNKDSNGEFITTEDKGLSIYTYKGNAAWVNGGILYTIVGNAPLSSDQIRRIASSL